MHSSVNGLFKSQKSGSEILLKSYLNLSVTTADFVNIKKIYINKIRLIFIFCFLLKIMVYIFFYYIKLYYNKKMCFTKINLLISLIFKIPLYNININNYYKTNKYYIMYYIVVSCFYKKL